MGPRSHERGNTFCAAWRGSRAPLLQWGRVLTNAETCAYSTAPVDRARRAKDPRFNGAAFSRTRKHGIQPTYGFPSASFNGAAFSRTRKPNAPGGGLEYYFVLQWGRVLTNAETSRFPFAIGVHGPASMGPRSHERGNIIERALRVRRILRLQWGRVLTNAETLHRPFEDIAIASCFNGAAFSRTRKL